MQHLSPSQLSMNPDQLAQASKVKLHVLPDAAAVHQHFARAISDEIQANNRAGRLTRLILPVGPIGQYARLVETCNQEGIHWHKVHTFNMDEYCDWQGRAIPRDHPLSFEGYMRREVFDRLAPHLRIPEENIHFPDPLRLEAISQAIARVGGIDTCYGGIGYHGHVAFNEPPVSRWYRLTPNEMRDSLTRVVSLAPETMVMNSVRNTGGDSTHFPPMGVTLGMVEILAARRLRFYCDGGAWQRHVLRIACLGREDVDYPVTLLQNHPDFVLITDLDTARTVAPAIGGN